jgi:hypothetical protein
MVLMVHYLSETEMRKCAKLNLFSLFKCEEIVCDTCYFLSPDFLYTETLLAKKI